MSKQPKRKITVDLGGKLPEAARPSVFERLGTKKAASKKAGGGEREHCRQWAAHGVCAYGKGCKFAGTHTLVSPSKARAAGKEDGGGGARLHSAVVRPDELDTWDQNDLEYADTDVLEKRRLQLQRELELQLKMDSGKPERKGKKKPPSSSSSSRSSSSTSASSSTSGGSSSSSSSERDRKKQGKKGKPKRNSSSSSDGGSPSKKKKFNKDTVQRGKPIVGKKTTVAKKDDRLVKKHDPGPTAKKKVLLKLTLGKKTISPGKKVSGTPPISKGLAKSYGARKHSKSPPRRDKNRSVSPTSAKDKERERQREREREREKERERVRAKSRSVQRKARSRSPRRSHPRDPRRKESSERSRPVSPKKARREQSTDKHRKSPTRDRDRRDHKDRSLERRKDEKDRHEREKLLARQRERDRTKDNKRDTSKRGRERREADRGLEKPSKPMERLLPRPEERLAALAAISNRNLEPDKSSTTSKDRQDSERGRKQDRMERDRRERSSKRDRMSLDRDHVDYDRGLDRGYDRGHSMDRSYDRVGERYDDVPREGDNRSPGYGRERHYDPGYDIPGHPRYPEAEDRGYGEHMGDHRGVDMGFEERRRREHSWEGSGSLERERAYHQHPHKEWEGEEFHAGGDWGRERHWQHREPQMAEWAEKEAEMEPGWHHRPGPPPGPHRQRMHDEGYGRNMRMEHPREMPQPSKRRSGPPRAEPEPPPVKQEPAGAAAPCADAPPADGEELPIPDDLSEISDDPDDILNRDDMVERGEEDSQMERPAAEERPIKTERTIKTEPHSEPYSNSQEARAVSPPPAALVSVKVEPQELKEEEEAKELDFEEISDGELEEERTRAGLGDALGVDWASLVAEVRRSKEPSAASGAQQRWQPHAVLARVGVSVAMAGAAMAAELIAESHGDSDQPPVQPVASIQVAVQRRRRQRAALFGTGCDVTRALSARRDLALRRHLCSLPPVERGGHGRGATQPHLFHAARTLLAQSG